MSLMIKLYKDFKNFFAPKQLSVFILLSMNFVKSPPSILQAINSSLQSYSFTV